MNGVGEKLRSPWQPCETKGWTQLQSKRWFSIELGKMLQNEPLQTNDSEVPYLKAQHVQWDGVRLHEPPRMWASSAEIESLRVKKGDLLVCEGGEVGRGAVVYAQPPENCIIQNALHLVRGRDGGDVRFLSYVLRHAASQGWFDVLCNRATIAHFTGDKFGEMWVWMPEASQQRAIADFLDRETARLDALVAAKERWLELLAEKRRALITRAVTRGLNADAPLRDSGVPWLGQIPAHWNTWKIRHFAEVGNGSTPNRDNDDFWSDGSVPWLNSSIVNQSEATASDQFVTPFAMKACHLPLIRPRSLLVAITGQGKTRGTAVVLSFRATINQHLAFITPNENLSEVWYLRWLFYAAYDFLRVISDDAGGTKGALTCEELGTFRVPLPPLAEQRAIVAHISKETAKLDALRSATERTIDLLKERRAALIAAAVTGQISTGTLNHA